MEDHRQEAALALGEKQPEDYRALVVPHRPGSIENQPAARRKDHLKFLNEIVNQANLADEEPRIEAVESAIGLPTPLAAAVCAVCAGACCHRAGDHAFLDEAGIVRFMAQNPKMEPANIVSKYAAHLPMLSYADSCVYHAVDGCTLPRSLRADICNTYRCSGLKQAELWGCDDGTTRAYVVVRQDNIIKHSAFVQPGNIRHYPPTDALPLSELLVNELKSKMN
jgi:hypothetical protein